MALGRNPPSLLAVCHILFLMIYLLPKLIKPLRLPGLRPSVSSPVSSCSETNFGNPPPEKKQPSFLRFAIARKTIKTGWHQPISGIRVTCCCTYPPWGVGLPPSSRQRGNLSWSLGGDAPRPYCRCVLHFVTSVALRWLCAALRCHLWPLDGHGKPSLWRIGATR